MGKLPRTVGFAGQCLRVELLPFLMSSLQPQTRGGWPCVHTWVFSILYWPCVHTWVFSILCNSPLSCCSQYWAAFLSSVLKLAFLHREQMFSYLCFRHSIHLHTTVWRDTHHPCVFCQLCILTLPLSCTLDHRDRKYRSFVVIISVFCVFK